MIEKVMKQPIYFLETLLGLLQKALKPQATTSFQAKELLYFHNFQEVMAANVHHNNFG